MSDEKNLDNNRAREIHQDGDKQALEQENKEHCYHQREFHGEGHKNMIQMFRDCLNIQKSVGRPFHILMELFVKFLYLT